MDLGLFFFAFIIWVIIVILAIFNGFVKEKFYKPLIGELRAHQISSIMFIIVIFAVSFLFIKTNEYPTSANQYLLVGLLWLKLTIIFEFLFGRYVAKHPWKKLLHDYNITKGRLWTLVLVATAFAPWILYQVL